mmetsp:Transcript_103831/g.303072  ORF Transcript_103831/g.303072 Transcript_103831/m.303072 type:complete len:225 (+) Transcript_103831:259-933(+)
MRLAEASPRRGYARTPGRSWAFAAEAGATPGGVLPQGRGWRAPTSRSPTSAPIPRTHLASFVLAGAGAVAFTQVHRLPLSQTRRYVNIPKSGWVFPQLDGVGEAASQEGHPHARKSPCLCCATTRKQGSACLALAGAGAHAFAGARPAPTYMSPCCARARWQSSTSRVRAGAGAPASTTRRRRISSPARTSARTRGTGSASRRPGGAGAPASERTRSAARSRTP